MPQATAELDTIGRFEIIKTLGEGAQGIVYLAHDPHLGRDVAIKSLIVNGPGHRQELAGMMMAEARTLCKFQHPNIVTIYEANEDSGTPFMVLEYVAGQTIAERLKKHGAFDIDDAVRLMVGILDGLSYCHRNQIVHSDIKPANIVIADENTPKLMDFGISRVVSGNANSSENILGTPRYLAPEYITRRELTTASDVFSCGLVFYEMLTGRKAVSGQSVDEVLNNITSGSVDKPSQVNGTINSDLEAVLLKALAKDPTARYPDASAMKQALEQYLAANSSDFVAPDESQHNTTVEFLLRRIRSKGDFPTLSQSFVSLNSLFAQENQNAKTIAAVILRDFALTNKILRIVNSATNARRGGKITTISRAIVALGFSAVRDIAASLILFDHLANKTQAEQLQNEIIASLYSGIVAKQASPSCGIDNAEESFICAMFHRLGSLLTTFYLHDESEEIQQRIETDRLDPEIASHQVLGVSYSELGKIIAEEWGFPAIILESMTPFSQYADSPNYHTNPLGPVASIANDISDYIGTGDSGYNSTAFEAICEKYSEHLGLDTNKLNYLVRCSNDEFAGVTSILKINTQASPFSQRILDWNKSQLDEEDIDCAEISADAPNLDKIDSTSTASSQEVLKTGLDEVSAMVNNHASIDSVIQTVLETMYTALGFNHVVFALASPKLGVMQARLGYGIDIEHVLNHFAFPLKYEHDIFHISLARGTDVFINDVNQGSIKDGLPFWYKNLFNTESFFLFPLTINKRAVGLLYADFDHAQRSEIPEYELNLMKLLREQAAAAFSIQRRQAVALAQARA